MNTSAMAPAAHVALVFAASGGATGFVSGGGGEMEEFTTAKLNVVFCCVKADFNEIFRP